MKRLAVIRGDKASKCPFGLSIIEACKNAGQAISNMQPIENADESVEANNKVAYLTRKEDARCPFADQIMEHYNTVNCSFGDQAAGLGSSYLPASPFYPRTMIGDGWAPGGSALDKGVNITDPRLTTYGPEKLVDVPFGMYSIYSNQSNYDALIKLASRSANKAATIKDKLALLRDRYFNTLQLLIPKAATKLNDGQLEALLHVIDEWTK